MRIKKIIVPVLVSCVFFCSCTPQKKPIVSSDAVSSEAKDYDTVSYKNFLFAKDDIFLSFDKNEDQNYDFNFESYSDLKSLIASCDGVVTGTVERVREVLVPYSDKTLDELENNRNAYPEKFEANIYSYEVFTLSYVKIDKCLSGSIAAGNTIIFAEIGDGKHRTASYIKKSGGYPKEGDNLLLFATKETYENYPDAKIILDGKEISFYTATLGKRFFIRDGKIVTDGIDNTPISKISTADELEKKLK